MVKVSKCQKYLVNSSPHCLWNEIGKLVIVIVIIIIILLVVVASHPVGQLSEKTVTHRLDAWAKNSSASNEDERDLWHTYGVL